jgi:hypothetical protein
MAALLAIVYARTLRTVHAQHGATCSELIDLGLQAIASLGAAPLATSPSLAESIATGEAPLAQACVMFVVQSAVIPNLPEADLRRMLELLADRCTSLLQSPPLPTSKCPATPRSPAPPTDTPALPLPRASVPEAIALLSTMSKILSAVGEVLPSDSRVLRDAVHKLLITSTSAVSYVAAAVLGQLAAVEGSSAAKFMMDYLSLVTLQTASLGSQSGTRHGAAFPLLPASPAGAPTGLLPLLCDV